jgi:hypothetical protein
MPVKENNMSCDATSQQEKYCARMPQKTRFSRCTAPATKFALRHHLTQQFQSSLQKEHASPHVLSTAPAQKIKIISRRPFKGIAHVTQHNIRHLITHAMLATQNDMFRLFQK